jgi:hypothetical protein
MQMKFIKTIYDECWESEYDLCIDKDGSYCLVPNKNTKFHIKPFEDFELEHNTYVYWLTWVGHHHKKPEDVLDVVSYNKVLCYVFAGNDENHFDLLPAINCSSGMAVGAAYFTIGNWGTPDFIKIDCQNCHHTFYYDENQITIGAKYEAHCPKCSMSMKRKK